MKTALLVCTRPLPDSWQPLLQHQAIVAAARAVLCDAVSEEPAWSGHRLLAPCNLDILPLLATVARDFAEFVEPEGSELPQAPILLYEDGSWSGSEGMDDLRPLLHPSRFQRLDLNLARAVQKCRPEICVVAGGFRRAEEQLAGLDVRFERRIYFECLMERHRAEEPTAGWIAADRLLQQAMEQAHGQREIPPAVWLNALRPAAESYEEWDLEPFMAFGPALERALWDER